MKKNKKTRSAVSSETVANLILLGAVLLAYVVYVLFFGATGRRQGCPRLVCQLYGVTDIATNRNLPPPV